MSKYKHKFASLTLVSSNIRPQQPQGVGSHSGADKGTGTSFLFSKKSLQQTSSSHQDWWQSSGEQIGKTAKGPCPDGYGNFAHQHKSKFPLNTLGPTVFTNKRIDRINLFSSQKGKKERSNKQNEIVKQSHESVFRHKRTDTCSRIMDKCLLN